MTATHNEKKAARRHATRRIRHYLARYKTSLVVGAVCLVITNMFLLATPWLLKLTIDELETGITRERLATLALGFVIVTAISGVFRFLMRRIMIGVSRKIEFDIRGDFFRHLETLSPAYYNRNRTGDLMALATNDLNAVRSLVGPGVMYSFNTISMSVAALSLMIYLSWQLTLVSLLPMIIMAVGMYYSMKLIHRYFERVQERFATLNSRAQENLAGIRVVKAYSREDHEIGEFEASSRDLVAANMKLFKVQSLLQPLLTSVAGLGGLFILAYGGWQVINSVISLGTFVAFTGYLTMLIWPMIALGWVMSLVERGLASMQRINKVLDEKPEILDIATVEGAAAAFPADRSIVFENVTFSYDTEGGRVAVLKDVSFKINDGETIAIVGPTGSGKTSLISLILRLYEAQQGRVLIGGVPIEDVPLGRLREYIGLIPQDIFLFSQTIADNVSFGVDVLEKVELERLAQIAAIHDEVLEFPKQFETMIGERGINLSGGQKQRLAISRALAKEPNILILDDALSSVDTDTEERILRSLRDEMRKRTSILISHRISTVREADRIFVLADGELVEQGTHADLIQRGGLYADMFNKQQIMYNLETG